MEALKQDVRLFVYTLICFQCILQLAAGSTYYRYIKLFSYLITLCICCNMIFSAIEHIEDQIPRAQSQYEQWIKQWEEIQLVGKVE